MTIKFSIGFTDGSKGIADLKKIIEKGGAFTELKNVKNFKNFFIRKELKVLSRENEFDIAPETLYASCGSRKSFCLTGT